MSRTHVALRAAQHAGALPCPGDPSAYNIGLFSKEHAEAGLPKCGGLMVP